jgi:hypothetical protein
MPEFYCHFHKFTILASCTKFDFGKPHCCAMHLPIIFSQNLPWTLFTTSLASFNPILLLHVIKFMYHFHKYFPTHVYFIRAYWCTFISRDALRTASAKVMSLIRTEGYLVVVNYCLFLLMLFIYILTEYSKLWKKWISKRASLARANLQLDSYCQSYRNVCWCRNSRFVHSVQWMWVSI